MAPRSLPRLLACALVLSLGSLASASADEGPPSSSSVTTVASASDSADERSPSSSLIPGSLDEGHISVEGGLSLAGDGPFGFGLQTVVGLGGVDLIGGVGALPGLCIFGTCSAPDYYDHGGAQLGILESPDGMLRLGVRGTVDVQTTGWSDFHMLAGTVIGSMGTGRHRLLAEVSVLGLRDVDDDSGAFLGGAIGYEYIGDHLGASVLFGAGLPLQGQSAIPLGSLELSFK